MLTRRLHNRKIRKGVSLGLLLLVFACTRNERPKDSAAVKQVDDKENHLFEAMESTKASFFLVGADSYTISLEGCASGYSATLTESNSTFDLYKGDRGCIAKLLDFSYQGQMYTPKVGSEFDTWAEGDLAVFISGDMSSEFTVSVASQLSNPVLATDTIDYDFFMHGSAGVNIEILRHSYGANGIVGQSSPDFRLASVEMVDTDGTQGSAKFVFTFECNAPLTNTGDTSLVACNGVRLADLDYVLVNDTYSSQPCQDSTLSTCNTIVTNNGPKTVDTATADYIAPGAGGLVN